MNEKEAIVDRLKDIMVNQLDANLRLEEIGDDSPLFDGGLALDSVILVELISLVEERFSVRFSDEELDPEQFSTVSVLADFIVQKKTATA